MNLRDKLRSGGADEEPADAESWSPAAEAEDDAPATRTRSVRASAKEAAAGLPRLDVNRRFLMLAGAAAFLTALTGVMYLNNSAAGLSAGGEKIAVVVLAEDVRRGAKLTEERLTTAEIPKAYLPKGYIAVEDGKGLEKAKTLVALAPMVAGEPLIEARVGPPDRKLGIAYLLKAGERAKTIRVDAASGLAGLIKPGNEVDLIATITDPNNDARRIGTPVLQKGRVIAVGDHLMGEVRSEEEEAKDESGGIESDSTVTLAVPAGKIAIVTLLEDLGNLKVVLRADGDTTIQKTAFTDEVLMSLVSGRVPVHRTAPPPRPVSYAAPRPRVVVREVPRQAPPRPVARPPAPRPAAKPPAAKPPASGGMPQVIRFGGSGGESAGTDD